MKKIFMLLFVLGVVFVVGCGDDDGVDTSAYAGNYAGTFTGDSTGIWQSTVTANGIITGMMSNAVSGLVNFSGDAFEDGTFTALAENQTQIAGAVNSVGAVVGTWTNPQYGAAGDMTGTIQPQ